MGVLLAHLLPGLRRLFIPRGELAVEVDRAAREAFYDRRVHHTEGSTGLLVYVSLFERRAVLLADERVQEKLGQQKLDALCAGLLAELKKGAYVDGLCRTLEEAGLALGNFRAGPSPRRKGPGRAGPPSAMRVPTFPRGSGAGAVRPEEECHGQPQAHGAAHHRGGLRPGAGGGAR